MNFILFDDATRYQLLPFTHTRPVADIHCGIMTMRERWELLLENKTSTLTEGYLKEVYPCVTSTSSILINATVFATPALAAAIKALQPGTQLTHNGLCIALHVNGETPNFEGLPVLQSACTVVKFTGEVKRLQHIWDIFSHNADAIKADFKVITQGRTSQPIPEFVTAIGKENIFIEEGAIVSPCIINASTGPVYIAAGAQILEGCMLRGPIALCKNSLLKMGAKIYGATTLGEGCKVGGEVNNVVFFANSNKSHDGYLGNAVIGEWCNLGADTNNSNLKNNYDIVAIWNEHQNEYVKTGLLFCGLFMGDHSKCGINTMFNTGTVVGTHCNIYGGGFPEKFIPSYSWGGSDGLTTYSFHKAMETAGRVMMRRNLQLSHAQEAMYRYVFEKTENQRG